MKLTMSRRAPSCTGEHSRRGAQVGACPAPAGLSQPSPGSQAGSHLLGSDLQLILALGIVPPGLAAVHCHPLAVGAAPAAHQPVFHCGQEISAQSPGVPKPLSGMMELTLLSSLLQGRPRSEPQVSPHPRSLHGSLSPVRQPRERPQPQKGSALASSSRMAGDQPHLSQTRAGRRGRRR